MARGKVKKASGGSMVSKVFDKKAESGESKQLNENWAWGSSVKEPSISAAALSMLYDNSYIVSGLTDKVSLWCDSGFKCDNEDLLNKINMLVDIELLVKNRLLQGSAFFEVIENAKWDIIRLEPVINDSVRYINGWDGFVQRVGVDAQYFNKWIPKEERDDAMKVFDNIQESKSDTLVPNKKMKCGWNSELNGIINFKRISLKDKDYGDSVWEPIIVPVTLIGNIDGNFDAFFQRGGINVSFLEDVKDNLSDEDFEDLVAYLESKIKGDTNDYSWVMVPTEVKKIDVTDKPVAKDLLPYRKELEKSCAVRLNIPYDLILSDNSNYASSKTAIEQMNKFLVKPEQKRLLKQLKYLFQEEEGYESIEFVSVDTSDDSEMSTVVNRYVGGPILTPDEGRAMIGKDPLPNGEGEKLNASNGDVDDMSDRMWEIEKMAKDGMSMWQVMSKVEKMITEEVNKMYE